MSEHRGPNVVSVDVAGRKLPEWEGGSIPMPTMQTYRGLACPARTPLGPPFGRNLLAIVFSIS